MTFNDGAGTVTKVVEFDCLNWRIAKPVDDDGDGVVDRSSQLVHDSSGKLGPAAGVPLDHVALAFEAPGVGSAGLQSGREATERR